jgi:pimeloyl-ACP methyl ester carboxylesterase
LVLIHGFIVNHKQWLAVIPGLASRFRVIAPDLPGFGASEKPRDYRYDREDFSETVCDLLAGLEIPRAFVTGHSLGGSVALTMAADHPERVERLAVIDSLCYPFPLPLKGRLSLMPVLGPLLFKRIYNRALIHAYFKNDVFPPGFAYDRALVDEYYRTLDPPDARDAAYRALLASNDIASLGPKINKVRAPTLVVWGDLDRLAPVALDSRLAREIPGARLEILPGCGHSPPEERPEKTVEILTRHFLGELH